MNNFKTMEHYTLNTNDTLAQPFSRLASESQEILAPFVNEAKQHRVNALIPGFPDYSFSLTIDLKVSAAVFDLKLTKNPEHIFTFNVVTWDNRGAKIAWDLASDLYAKTYNRTEREVIQPQNVPWLATVIFSMLTSVETAKEKAKIVSDVTWFADFECSLAQTICLLSA